VIEHQAMPMPEALPKTTAKPADGDGRLTEAARLQILSTEHWSLLATRSMSWSESFSRTSMFLSTLTGSVVALALVAQAMPGEGFTVFALLLLPVVLFLGLATYARLCAINVEDAHWVVGMNRIRHAYIELAPDLEQYFISGVNDDPEGVMKTFAATTGSGNTLHAFVTTPGMLAVINAVLAGVLAGIAAGFLIANLTLSILTGVIAFVIVLVILMRYGVRSWERYLANSKPKFPRSGPATG
jgi:hypothetical protein